MDTSPPNLCTNIAHINDSSSPNGERNESLFCAQDKEILSISEELKQVQRASITSRDQLSGYFCSDTVFNLNKIFLSDMKLKISEKGYITLPFRTKLTNQS